MSIKKLTKLQWLFAIASLSYLLVSLFAKKTTGEPISAAPIGYAIPMFIIYIACLQLTRLENLLWYRLAMVVAVVIFGGGGVIGNIWTYINSGLEQYASMPAFIVAVAINLYGTILNLIAIFTKLKR